MEDTVSRLTGLPLITDDEWVVEIVGIRECNRGRSCAVHECCGKALKVDSVVRIKACSIWISELNKEEDAIEVVLVSGGKDTCRVGFLPAFLIDDARLVHNRLAQVVSFLEDRTEKKLLNKNNQFRGMCRAQVIDMDIVHGSQDEDDEEKIDPTWDSSNDEESKGANNETVER